MYPFEQVFHVLGVPVAAHEENPPETCIGGEPREDDLVEHPSIERLMFRLETEGRCDRAKARVVHDVGGFSELPLQATREALPTLRRFAHRGRGVTLSASRIMVCSAGLKSAARPTATPRDCTFTLYTNES